MLFPAQTMPGVTASNIAASLESREGLRLSDLSKLVAKVGLVVVGST